MSDRRPITHLLFAAVLIFGVAALVCACAARRGRESEFPKLTETPSR